MPAVTLALVGLNHQSAPVEVRECLAPPADLARDWLAAISQLEGIREAFLISTCNRVEVLAAADSPAAAGTIRDWLTQGRNLPPDRLAPALYTHLDGQAVRHLFRVASSLDSLVVGEPQILGQIKDAYRLAADLGTSRTVLNRLLHKTFQVAKRVRTQTNIGGAAVSVSFAAVELAKKIFDELAGLGALLVGAGEMAELAAEHLLNQGVSSITVVNRTLARAVNLASRWGGAAASLDDLPRVLGQVDIVITSTGAVEPVITHAMAKKALKKRRGKPLFFIDIAVPRDVDQRVGELDGCFVYDIDDLTQVVEANRQNRAGEAAEAELIVAEEVLKFQHWLESLAVSPTISALTLKAEAIRRAELERTLKILGAAGPEVGQALDNMTRSLIKKLLHDPIRFLKESAHEKNQETTRAHLALTGRIFGLEENGEGEGGDLEE
ncbi:MAG: glutamyl-tRNA reductase [Deltaproteobacteria bacterium]|nr:glutamyl-tRNA reductase [Deltaproteobacteria bacterium]